MPELDAAPTSESEHAPRREPALAGRDTIEAFFGLLRSLPAVAGVVVALSGLGYLVGWWIESTYYAAFGAEWLANRLTTADLLDASIPFLGPLVLTACFTTLEVARAGRSDDWLRTVRFWLSAIAFVLILVGAFVPLWVASHHPHSLWGHPGTRAEFIFLALFAVGAAVGVEVTMLTTQLRESRGRWGASQFWFVHAFLSVSLWQAPQMWGRARGAADTDPRDSSLPVVTGIPDSLDWRLLTMVGDHLVLAHLRVGKPPWLRFVPPGPSFVIRESTDSAP